MAEAERASLFDEDLTARPILPQLIVREAMDLLESEPVVSLGSGTHNALAGKFMMGRTRRHLRSVGLGQMGFCFPAALGAKLALPDVPTLVMVGDGDFAEMVKLFGAHGERVEDPTRVRPALEAAFASGKPVVLGVIIDRNEFPRSVHAFYQGN